MTAPFTPPETPDFPAARMEVAAREKAWSDFLAHIRFSLEVWAIDPDVRAGCEHPVRWIRRLATELASLGRRP